jgi:hypothetical protein
MEEKAPSVFFLNSMGKISFLLKIKIKDRNTLD